MMIINEQFVVHGNVDFPPTDQNMVPIITVLSPLGFMPNTVQEINADGTATFRMALGNMKDTQIIFGVNKVQVTRSAPLNSQSTGDFIEFALGVLEKINTVREIVLTRIGMTRDRFLSEASPDEMDGVFRNLFSDNVGVVPFEWSFRTTSYCTIQSENDLIVTEIGRAQGTINDNGRLSEFDRLRLKVDVGTDHKNTTPRFKFAELRDIANKLDAKIVEQEKLVEGKLYG